MLNDPTHRQATTVEIKKDAMALVKNKICSGFSCPLHTFSYQMKLSVSAHYVEEVSRTTMFVVGSGKLSPGSERTSCADRTRYDYS